MRVVVAELFVHGVVEIILVDLGAMVVVAVATEFGEEEEETGVVVAQVAVVGDAEVVAHEFMFFILLGETF